MRCDLVFNSREIEEKGGLVFDKALEVREFLEDGQPVGAWDRAFADRCLSGACKVHLEFSIGGSRILLEGRIAGRWKLACSRCLAAHDLSFETALEETYPSEGDRIDAGPEVREALILSVPQKSVCNPSCLGLCPGCGKNLNLEPCGCPPDRALASSR
ncbi:MAG: DUF177 domain-containing protein [Elusimicrobia bacterium]|nr:DUF177 domain-containing protein [Elusimicrobiota bacterium]